MIRRVAFGKALLAGAAGALAWELVILALIWAGLPLSDISRGLGLLAAPGLPSVLQWAIGLVIHMGVGAIWTVFYAYFFWSTFDIAPVLQGLIFCFGPAILAGLIVVPQIGYMSVPPRDPGIFGLNDGWGGLAGNLIGHVVYGILMGALYVRPVGTPVLKELQRA